MQHYNSVMAPYLQHLEIELKFSGIGSQECDDLGMADIAEVEAVRSYAYSHGQFTVKPVSKLLQRFDSF